MSGLAEKEIRAIENLNRKGLGIKTGKGIGKGGNVFYLYFRDRIKKRKSCNNKRNIQVEDRRRECFSGREKNLPLEERGRTA